MLPRCDPATVELGSDIEKNRKLTVIVRKLDLPISVVMSFKVYHENQTKALGRTASGRTAKRLKLNKSKTTSKSTKYETTDSNRSTTVESFCGKKKPSKPISSTSGRRTMKKQKLKKSNTLTKSTSTASSTNSVKTGTKLKKQPACTGTDPTSSGSPAKKCKLTKTNAEKQKLENPNTNSPSPSADHMDATNSGVTTIDGKPKTHTVTASPGTSNYDGAAKEFQLKPSNSNTQSTSANAVDSSSWVATTTIREFFKRLRNMNSAANRTTP